MEDDDGRRRRLGQALRSLRESLGLTIYDAARRMGRPRSYGSQIGRWERGQAMPGADRLWALLSALGLSFADLERALNPAPAVNPRLREIARRLQRLP